MVGGGSGEWVSETIAVFEGTEEVGEPLTTREVTERLDCTRRAAYDRLHSLVERGVLNTKKVGARGRIWWQVTSPTSAETFETMRAEASVPPLRTGLQFESLVDAVSEYAIFVLDDAGRVVTWNQGVERIKGYEADEIIGTHFSVFYPPADREAGVPQRNLTDAARESSIQDEGWRVRKDESQFRAQVTLTAITDDTGAVWGYVKVIRDMTRQYRHKQRLTKQRDGLEQELDDVFERVDDGFLAVDDEYRLVYVNERAEDLLETPAGKHLGEPVWSTVEALDETTVQECLERVFEAQEPATCESYVDGLDTWLETSIHPSEAGVSVYFRDVTARREHERELQARVRQQEVVTELGWFALENSDVDDLMDHAATLVSETLDTDYTKVLELDANGDELLLRQGFGWDDGIVGNATVSAVDDDSQAAHTLRTEEPIVVEDLGSERRFTGPELLTSHGVASGISTIIGSADGPWGILGTHDTERKTFTEHDINFVQSVAHILTAAIDRHEYERALEQYETIIETIDDGVYVLDETYHFAMVNQSYREMMGYDADALLGSHCSVVVGDEISSEAAARSKSMSDGERPATLEAKIERADGSHFFAESRFTRFPSDDDQERAGDVTAGKTVGVVRDTTERRQRERDLERQRAQLAALNDLNGVIRDITEAVIDQSTREEIESAVCKRLTDSEAYQFAWVGELSRSLDTVRIKTAAGYECLEGSTLPLDQESDTGYENLVETALRTQSTQYRHRDETDRTTEQPERDDTTFQDEGADAEDHNSDHPLQAFLAEMNDESSVVIPIVHAATVLGVLVVSTDRPDSFQGGERATIDHLGELIGHAIASIERKRALMSDEVIELQVQTEDLSATLGIPPNMEGTVTIEKTVALNDDRYVAYGVATDDAVATLETICEASPDWEQLTIHQSDDGDNTFELHLSGPPVTSAVAAQGGAVVDTRIVEGVIHLKIHLPPGANVRKIIDVVESTHPDVEMVMRRQVKRDEPSIERPILTTLTDRQRSTLEACYHAGFFEWPRASSGEEVAESLGISSPTFHQHLRAAQKKVVEALLT
ncbi:putative PAS/PAC sensor protein [Haloferax elongans ATCC BAA-1513]|uniref:Putative PAS/PAC sensor protein n=1 Tax=Haloferax elongans ATCC BAA-1513 TaxID=1230453 RepID=M0HUJ8_HALEO|nr:PAS domain S-box protein [Haloferax elongans]ELZ87357.1 putative PAS/PAC sensor protein [Haloferax elongans ATCC BAA-1513]